MGNDLVAACIYCASLFLGRDAPPLYGFTGEVMGAYGTLRRQTETPPGRSYSDTTGKFPFVAIGWTRPAAPGMGAGTPAWEVSGRLGWAASHSESFQPVEAPDSILSSGAGRFENVAIAVRGAVATDGSAEFLFVQHRFVGDDVYDVGGLFQYAGERLLIAMRRDLSIGWRQRFAGAEVAVRLQRALLQGKLNTADGLLQGDGAVWGGGAEALLVRGPWRFFLGGEWLSGSIPREEQFGPSFQPASGQDPAVLGAAGFWAERSVGRASFRLAGFWQKADIGWVSYSMLGETLARFNDGFRPASASRTLGIEVTARVLVGTGVCVKAFGRAARTEETVTFTDALYGRPSATLDVLSPATNQFAFGLGLEFTLGGKSF